MKNLNIYLLLFVTLTFCSFTYDFSLPTESKLAGKWESVFRSGNDNCDKDFIITFELEGKATITSGSRYDSCESSDFSVKSWEVGKVEGRKAIIMDDDGDEINIIIDTFVGDYMKVYLNVISGDTTMPKGFIMKKIQ